jgi:hypothetical protein
MSMILLTVPTLFPVIMGMDFYGLGAADKAQWFGILILTVCAIGMIFPPVGLNVYIMNGLAKDVPMTETYKGVVPFLITDFIRLGLLIAFPPGAVVRAPATPAQTQRHQKSPLPWPWLRCRRPGRPVAAGSDAEGAPLPAGQQLCQHAADPALVRQDRQGIGQPPEVPDLPQHAARRYAAATV